MKRWVFCTLLKGKYFSADESGHEREHSGLSLYLGTKDGETEKDALEKLLFQYDTTLPSLRGAIISSFEVTSNGHIAPKITPQKEEKPIDNCICCEWCQKDFPSYASAARFSHLKKHLRELVKKGLLSQEACLAVNSLNISEDLKTLLNTLKKGKRKG